MCNARSALLRVCECLQADWWRRIKSRAGLTSRSQNPAALSLGKEGAAWWLARGGHCEAEGDVEGVTWHTVPSRIWHSIYTAVGGRSGQVLPVSTFPGSSRTTRAQARDGVEALRRVLLKAGAESRPPCDPRSQGPRLQSSLRGSTLRLVSGLTHPSRLLEYRPSFSPAHANPLLRAPMPRTQTQDAETEARWTNHRQCTGRQLMRLSHELPTCSWYLGCLVFSLGDGRPSAFHTTPHLFVYTLDQPRAQPGIDDSAHS
ncbi:unnamed protein product [Rhizoctonia solani]|uniref:Uncharacterized protein n=1 Tax=Rhizoctonia solani TaxID=456999 RepID=A0A8H2Y7R7_9AGAM|nr:unnamed protein product [Rhizoctonia solani]